MKVNIIDENNIIVFLFERTDYLKDALKSMKSLFEKLKKIYNLDIEGYYFIDIYKDPYYGMVLELEKERTTFLSLTTKVDARIEVHDVTFLYQVDDPFFITDFTNINVYYYKDKIYLKLNDNNCLKVVENSKLIYKNTDNIIKQSKIMI